jgi:hypothetical protein
MICTHIQFILTGLRRTFQVSFVTTSRGKELGTGLTRSHARAIGSALQEASLALERIFCFKIDMGRGTRSQKGGKRSTMGSTSQRPSRGKASRQTHDADTLPLPSQKAGSDDSSRTLLNVSTRPGPPKKFKFSPVQCIQPPSLPPSLLSPPSSPLQHVFTPICYFHVLTFFTYLASVLRIWIW